MCVYYVSVHKHEHVCAVCAQVCVHPSACECVYVQAGTYVCMHVFLHVQHV